MISPHAPIASIIPEAERSASPEEARPQRRARALLLATLVVLAPGTRSATAQVPQEPTAQRGSPAQQTRAQQAPAQPAPAQQAPGPQPPGQQAPAPEPGTPAGVPPAGDEAATDYDADGRATPDNPALAAAEAALAEARRQKEEAYAALEALVEALADDYVALTTGPDATGNVHALVLALQDSLPTAKARLATEAAKGRTLLRGTRRQILQDVFTAPLTQAAPVDPRLCAWVAARIADQLSTRENLDTLSEDQLLAQVRGLFPAGLTWYQFWNRSFHADLPDALRLQQATTTYEAAGLALDRLRHPERYGSKGEVAPAGMVVVPGGTYELGPNTGWERPSHRTTLKVFAIDRSEVTQGQYAVYVNALPPGERAAALPRGWKLDTQQVVALDPALHDHPVEYVNWEQAAAYAAWAGKRLPTEDEWEAAAGGLQAHTYPWGDEFRAGYANDGDEGRHTLPVESFPQGVSPAGCFDMAGNVWEWTATQEDGKDIDALPEGLVNVVIRGGGYSSRREELATRYRWTAPGHEAFASLRYTRPIGFRCVKDL